MKVRDLGELAGDLVIFGGPYSNFQALSALLEHAAQMNIARQNFICTGDVVAYCGAPDATLALMRDNHVACVAGNCEVQLAANAPDCGCGFAPGSTCDTLSAQWYEFAQGAVDDDARAWMRQLPDLIVFRHAAKRYAVLHGGATDIARYIWPTSPGSDFQTEIDCLRAEVGALDGVIAGHCGIAFERTVDGVRWINPGVIGMPPHDGNPQTRYGVLRAQGFEIYRLTYDARSAAADMVAAGLTQGYHAALTDGFWPSEDILPTGLRRFSHRQADGG